MEVKADNARENKEIPFLLNQFHEAENYESYVIHAKRIWFITFIRTWMTMQ